VIGEVMNTTMKLRKPLHIGQMAPLTP
jgi:hypothetical protein